MPKAIVRIGLVMTHALGFYRDILHGIKASDLFAVADAQVSAAVGFIHRHAHQVIRVDDILEHVPIARRALERRFRKSLHRSISEENRRVHIERSKHLLTDTKLSIAEIAHMSGFCDGRQLSILFRQATGMTPTEFRRQFRMQT